MRPNLTLSATLVVCTLCLGTGAAGAATRTVTDAGDSGPGTLRQALADAVDGDVIDFDLTLPATITLTSGRLEVTDDVDVQGLGADQLTVSGDGDSMVFFVGTDATATLSGLEITDGSASSAGGIQVEGALTLRDSTVTGNTGANAGGITVGNATTGGSGVTLTVENSLITENSGTLGGGLRNVGGSATLVDTTVSDNTASKTSGFFGRGGGIENGGSLTLIDCTVSGNVALDRGGGVSSSAGSNTEDASFTIISSTISGNAADERGGGIFSAPNAQSSTIINSTISGNTTNGNGGGIQHVGRNSLSLFSTTVTNNTADADDDDAGDGGGIYSNIIKAGHELITHNSIVADNSGVDCHYENGQRSAEGTNFDTDGTCTNFTTKTSTELALGTLQDNGGPTATHALGSGSVALDAVADGDCLDDDGSSLAVDQRGAARPADGDGDATALCDVGAFELTIATFELSVTPAEAPEGDADRTVPFTVTRSGGTGDPASVEVALDGTSTASPGGDFTDPGFPVTVDFGQDVNEETVEISVSGDTVVEPDETIVLALENPSTGTELGETTSAAHTVENDDAATLTLGGVSRAEGTGGDTPFTFPATLSHAVQGGFTVAYATNEGTATLADGDFTDNDGSLAFAGTAGEMQAVTVQVAGDSVVEPDEAFSVALGAISDLAPGIDPGALTPAGSPAPGTIEDDDAGVFDATFEADKTVAGDGTYLPGSVIDYTVVVTNLGPGDRADLPGDELVDILPPELELLSAASDLGTAAADPGSNTVTWNGALASGASATVAIQARILEDVSLDTPVTNQATLAYDTDNDGAHDAQALSDDPASDGPEHPTTLLVAADSPTEIPVLGPWGAAALTLLLAATGWLVMRRLGP